jgi:hypothetical protein
LKNHKTADIAAATEAREKNKHRFAIDTKTMLMKALPKLTSLITVFTYK